MTLFAALREFVLVLQARRTQTHGGDSNASESDTEDECTGLIKTVERAGGRNQESIVEDDTYPQAILHNGQVILAGGHGADWIRAHPDCTVYLEENV